METIVLPKTMALPQAKINVKVEKDLGEKEFTEQKIVFKSDSDFHSGYRFVRMLGRIAGFWEQRW